MSTTGLSSDRWPGSSRCTGRCWLPISVALLATSLTAPAAGCGRCVEHEARVGEGIRGRAHGPGKGAAELLFYDGFESGSLSRWSFRWLRRRASARIVARPVRHGKAALEISLRRGDPMFSKGKRSELQVPGHFQIGKAYWYGFSVYLPPDWKEDFKAEVVAQWFATRDEHLGERPRSPSLALRIKDRRWIVTYRYDRKRLSVGNGAPKGKVLTVRYRRGVWTDWVFFVRWSWGDDGLTRVWKDGELLASRAGPNTYNDAVGPILKIGIYKAPWNRPEARSAVSSRTLYFDEVRVARGAGGYEVVAPPNR